MKIFTAITNCKKTAFACLAVLFCLLIKSNYVVAQGPGSPWGYARTISLSTPTTLANYQVKVTLTTAIMSSPYANVNSDGSDLRFYDNNNISCPYWIESFANNGNSVIWVKVVSSGATSLTMYYGNATATATSSGTNTFDFFDDFSSSSLNSNWQTSITAPGSVSPSGILSTGTTNGGSAYLSSPFTPGSTSFYLETKHQEGAYYRNRFYASTSLSGSNPLGFDNGYFYNGSAKASTTANVFWNGTFGSTTVNANTYYLSQWKITDGSSTNNYAWNNFLYSTYLTGGAAFQTNTGTNTAGNVRYITYGVTENKNISTSIDWVRVRKSQTTEPTTTVGTTLVPIITGLGSTSGCQGTSITINGYNLNGVTVAANVKIGGTAVSSITSSTGPQIVAVIGSGTTGTVSVTTAGGTATSAATFTVNPNNTAGAPSSSPNVCINTAIPNVTIATTGATGIGTATGLPTGVTASFASNTITISGTPSASGTFNYTIPLTGGCGTVNANGTITVRTNNTAGTPSSSPNVCINTAIPNVTIATTGATGIGTATGLPSGVTASFASNTITISGTPSASGTFNYTIPLTGGCGTVNATGTITVRVNNTAGSPSSNPTLCISTAISPAITIATTGATGIGTATGLPSGVTASFASNTITISGTPSASGTFNYTIPLTGGCGIVNATGTITLTANNTAGSPSSSPNVCINTAIAPNITIATTGATGIGTATGLPTGVTASFASNTITISGTPSASGTFNYTIPLTGGCGTVNATGTITVTANNTAGSPSSSPNICINTAIAPNITIATTGATGIGTATGLPTGVTASFASNTITISGTPTASGTFNYTIPLTGGCGTVNATGIITVTDNNTAGTPSSSPTLCINTAIAPNITIAITGATGIGTATGLPTGVTTSFASNTITISGTPTASGTFNYTIPLTGGCGIVNATGTISVNPLPDAAGTITGASAICQGQAGIGYSVGLINNATSYTWAYSGTGVTINGTSNSITIDFSAAATSGNLTVTGVNNCGNGTVSANYPITVNQPPVVTADPTPATQTLCATQNVSYSVTATGTNLTYQWYRGTTALTDVGRISGATTSTLTITGITAADGGDYTVVVSGTGPCSSATSAVAHLDVNQSIIFSAQPLTPQTICEGSSYTIFAQATGATGTGSTYQWYHNGNPYATGNFDGVDKYTLTIPAVTPSDAGTYRLYLDDGSGTTCSKANSNIASLIVNPTPTATISGDATVCQNGTAPVITFTNPMSLAVTVTYNINGGTNTTINVAANNTATIAVPTAANGSFAYNLVSVAYQSAPGCDNVITGTATITVNLTPSVTAKTSATCNGTGFTVTPVDGSGGDVIPAGTTYSWSAPTVTGGLTGGTTGSGASNISGTLTNPTSAPQTATYTVTPTAGSCDGTTFTVTITVNPTPILSSSLTPPAICNNTAFNYTPTSATTGTTFNWSRAVVAGISNAAATGTNNPNETLINTTTAPVSVVYVYSLSANGCSNTQNVTVTVNPTPTLTSSLTPPARCSNTSGTYSATSATGGVTYSWSRAAVTGISNAAATGSGAAITETLINTTANPVNVVYAITLTANGCSNTQSVTITINPTPTLSSSLTPAAICNNTIFSYTPTSATTGTTFDWSRAAVTGISNAAATGTNNPNETLINATANPINVIYVYTLTANGCTNTQNVTVSVKPTPVLNSTLTPPARCSNVSATYTASSATSGTTYAWTRAAVTGITPATGTGGSANITETLVNSTANPVTVTYVIVLTANGCSNTQNVTVTVNPSPTLSSTLTPPAICSNTIFSYTPTSATTGVTFNWSRAAVTGISNTAASGTNNPNETLINTTANPINVTYVYTLSANGCSNTQNVVVTVNPTPTLSSTLTPAAICNNTSFSYNPTSATAGTTFDWSRAAVTGISNAAATGTNNPNETLINTTANPISVVYVYTLTANGCTNTQNVTVSVKPTPTLSSTLTPPARCSNVSTTYTATSATSSTTYTWSRAAVTGITPNTGSGGSANIVETLVNSTTNPITITYVIVLTANGCSNTQNVNVTVNPSPTLSSTLTPAAICNNTSFSYNPTSATTGVTFNWSRAAVTGISNAAASGTNNPNETLTNTTVNPINVTYVYTLSANGCSNTQNVVVTVNPTPVLSSSLTQSRCDNVSATYTATSSTSGTTYTWTRAAVTGISNAAGSGSGAAITETLDNTTTDPVSIVYVITLTANGCSNTQNVTVTVNPTPVLSSTLTPPARCSNVSTPYTATSATGGVTYTWSRAAVTGITPNTGSGGTANIVETLVNSTANPINITYAITLAANGCSNTQNVVVTINPSPTLTSSLTQNRCDNVSTTYTATSATSGVTYSWSRAAVTGISNAAASGTGSAITESLDNTTANPINITYVITLSANGCSNTQNVTVTVNPTPVLSSTLTPPARCSNTSGTYTATSATTAATFTWSRAAVTGISNAAASGSGATITETLINTTASPVTVIYAITLTINTCTNTQNVSVVINPLPTITTAATAAPRCFSASAQTSTLAYSAATQSPTTYSINYNAAANSAGFVDVTDAPLPATPITINIAAGTVPSTYTGSITVKNANGCSSSSGTNFTITINALPVPTLTNNPASPVCANTNVTYTTDAGQSNYVWTFSGTAGTDYTIVSGGNNTSNTAVVTWKTSTPATKTVTVNYNNSNGCTAVTPTSNSITVLAVPSGSITVTENSGTTANDNKICAGDAVTFTAPSGYGSYTWKVNGTTVQGPNTDNSYSTTTLAAGQTVTVDIANANNCGATFTAPAVTVSPLPLPALTVTESSGTPNDKVICPNAPVTLTATANAGSTYSFIINGSVAATGTSNTYTTTAIATTSTVAVTETNSNGCQATTANQTITVTAVPSGTLSVSPGSSFCSGTSVTFTATTGFSNYNFKVNSVSKQSNGTNTYTTNALTNGQVVTVDVTNSNGCTTTFNPISVTVNPLPTGTLTATENSGVQNDNSICAGAPVTFTFSNSTYSNYNFKVNGTSKQNGLSNSYVNSTLASGDVVTVDITSGSGCMATFTAPAITVNPSPTGILTETDNSGTTNDDKIICAGDNATFTTTTGFANYNFQVNNVTVQNGTLNTFSSTSLTNGDIVSVDVTNSNSCVATFNTITMVVNPLPSGTLAIAENAGTPNDGITCTGTSVTFTAPNGFTNYNFLLNGVSVQNSSSKTYTTTTLANGDKVSVAVTNGGGCIGLLNQYTITVNPLPTVAPITTTAPSFDVCVGSAITLQDATNMGGSFTWSSENPGFATVNSSTGVVTGVAAGTAVIDYIYTNSNGCSKTVTATVTVHALPTVQPITGNFNICTGTDSQLGDATSGGAWNSNNTGVATVDATGLVHGAAQGTATISYTVTDAYSCSTTVTADVTVSDFPSVSPITTASSSGFNVCTSGTLQLNDATSGGTWNITNGSGSATISSGGLVTGVSAGTVTAYYSISSSCGLPASSSQVINVNAPPSATISYAGGSAFCTSSGSVAVTQTGTTGGTYSSAGGLTINSSTGTITPASSTAGSYTVTYTLPASATGGCGVYTTTTSVNITAAPTITSFIYSGTPYCSTVTSASPSLTASSTSGTYSSTTGLTINSATGVINPSTSTAGTYTVTYTIAASGGCAAVNKTTSVTITTNPTIASFSYSGTPYCSTVTSASPSLTASSTSGTYSSTTGLIINAATGVINPSTSTAGTYTVTYSIAATGGCAIVSKTTSVVITAAPTAVAGTAISTCSNSGPVNVTAGSSATNYSSILWTSSGTGTFANANSLTTATYTPSAADISAGNVTLTLKANGNGSCAAATSTKTLTINAAPAAFVITPAGPVNLCQGTVQPLTTTTNTTTTGSVTILSGNINLAIPDATQVFIFVNPGSVTSNLAVSTVPAGSIINSVSVNFNINHTYDGDLVLNLKAPNGKVLNLVDQRGRGGDNFTNTTVSSNSTNPFLTGAANAPYTGTFVADGDNGVGTPNSGNNVVFSDLFSTPNGTWTFGAEDDDPGDQGTILNWSLTFNYTIPNSPLSVTWSPTTDLFTDAGATTAYTGTAVSTVYAKPSTSGTKVYTATATNAANCSTSQNVTLNVGALPNVTIAADYCAVAGKVQLTANATPTATSYLWSTGETTQTILVDVAGTYTVTVYSGGSCPGKGTINIANELVTNGNFEAGNTGFTSPPLGANQYQYRADVAGNTELVPEGLYGIGTDAQNYHPNFWGHDHTTGSGNFMIVNGFPNGNPQPIVWQETVSVLPNTTYYFSAWGMSLNNAGPFAQLQFNVNGAQVGSVATLSAGVNNNSNNGWTRFYGTLTTGANVTSAVISITDLQNAAGGNDFALDDISFSTLSTFVDLQSAAGTDAQTVCVNNAIQNIVYSAGSSASAPTVTGLPAGITSSWNGVYLTISGTPTAAGNYSYTVTTTGSCQPASATGTITVQAQKIALSSGSASPSVCANAVMSNIVFTLSGTATNASTTGLPTGVTGTVTGSGPTYTYTISGTPTAAPGPYAYTITTSGTCTPVTFNGTITVTSQTITLNSANNTQTVCINAPIANIQYTIGGTGTGASATGLPPGVTGSYNSGLFVISGSPTSAAGSPYNYTVSTTGSSCAQTTATGKITVTPAASFTLTSGAATNPQTVCKGSAITNITYSVSNATGASATGLPAGVTGAYSGGVFTISGTPTAAVNPGPYTYTVTSSGGCAVGTTTGTITVQAQTISLTSGTASPSVCANAVMTNIVYTISGTATGASVTGLPTGVTGTLSGSTFTIGGTPTAASGPYNYTITTSGTCGAVTANGTITISPAAVGGTIASVSICSGSSGTLTLTGQTGTVVRWEVSTDFGMTWTPIANATITQGFNNITTTTMYRVQVTGCGTVYSSVATVGVHNLWTGRTSTDWNLTSNWSDNLLPSSTCTTVMIPAGTPNQPQLTSSVTVPSLMIAPNTTVDLNGNTLTINGSFTGSATGNIKGSPASGLIIGGAANTLFFDQTVPSSNNVLKTFTVNNGSNATLGNALNITAGTGGGFGSTSGILTVNGTLNTGGNLTIRSNQYGDAVVGPSSGTPTISGNVTVERYVPKKRAWRFMAIPTNGSQTINAAWQEGQANQGFGSQATDLVPGYGTEITYDNIYTHGFDYNTTTNPSIKLWDIAANDWKAPSFTPFTNSTSISSYPAYCLFVRGSRDIDLSLAVSAGTDPTTLRTKGSLNFGPVTKTYATQANNGVLIANPYASPIDITNVLTENNSIFQNQFAIWDPGYAGEYGVGGYRYWANGWTAPSDPGTYTGGTNAQSGQAFMLTAKNTSSGVGVNFIENDKVPSTTGEAVVFGRVVKENHPAIYANLMSGSGSNLAFVDGVTEGFGKDFSAKVDGNDAQKFANFDENMVLIRNEAYLAIELRPVPILTDTFFYRLYLRQEPYTLQIFGKDLEGMPGQAWLVDKYLNTKTPVNLEDTTLYSFTPNTDLASYRDRFMLVFKRSFKATPVATSMSSGGAMAATLQGTVRVYPNPVKTGEKVLLKFSNMKPDKYEVMLSSMEGKALTKKTIQHGGGDNNYDLQLDARWTTGNYLIKITSSNGYSTTTKLVIGK